MSVVKHIENILTIRDHFHHISRIDKTSEIMKVWARWIITHRSLCKQHNLVLPDDNEYDSQLIIELQEKGVNRAHAVFLHRWLIDECNRINKSYTPVATMENGGLDLGVKVKVEARSHDNSSQQMELSLDGKDIQTLPKLVYMRMSRRFTGVPCKKDNYIWLCATLYSLLDGKGLQWAVPPQVMSLLQSNLSCYTELFASPLNSYNTNYYSLFAMDRLFGSKGNFFHAPNTDFQEGTYQINPPFIDQLFTKTSERVLELLDIADAAGKELTFIYIMPEWKDFQTYDMIAESRFCVKRIFLRSGQHYYYQYSSGSYIPARFGSYMFFLSTNSRICSNSLESNIRYAFAKGI